MVRRRLGLSVGGPRSRRFHRKSETGRAPRATSLRSTSIQEGSIWLGVSVNLFGLSSHDRAFVLDLIDRVRGYQKVAQQDSERGVKSGRLDSKPRSPLFTSRGEGVGRFLAPHLVVR